MLSALERSYRKWPGGTYMLWFPVKDEAAPRFVRQLTRLGIEKILRLELHVAPPNAGGLAACGLAIVNPPWQMADHMKAALPEVVKQLGQTPGARFIVETLR
jgi:23S rRNA (adenine2030-N6)-methyltransferase